MKTFLEVVKPKKDPGVYMSVKFDQTSNDALAGVQKMLNLKNPVGTDKLHSTVVYSRKTVDLFPMDGLSEVARLVGFEVWNTKYGKTVIGNLESDFLHRRFKEAMDMGATYDYDDYNPHVTLAYDGGDGGDIDISEALSRVSLPMDLRIVSEHTESLDLDKQVDDIT